MGIREYFKERTEEEVKFQDFRFQELDQSSNIKFDVETEITEKDWKEQIGKLEEYRKNKSWWDFAYLAMRIKIIQREKIADLKIEQAWSGMMKKLAEYQKNESWWNFAQIAMRMKILQPKKAAELDIGQA